MMTQHMIEQVTLDYWFDRDQQQPEDIISLILANKKLAVECHNIAAERDALRDLIAAGVKAGLEIGEVIAKAYDDQSSCMDCIDTAHILQDIRATDQAAIAEAVAKVLGETRHDAFGVHRHDPEVVRWAKGQIAAGVTGEGEEGET